MLDVTAWVLAVWAKWTVVLAIGVGVVWLVLPTGSVWFWVTVAAAAWAEFFITRQLCREWAHQAHFSWWWAR